MSNNKISVDEIYNIIQEERENIRVELNVSQVLLREIASMKESGVSKEIINEQFLDWLGRTAETLLPGLVQKFKMDVAWMVLSRLGVSRDSLLGTILVKSLAELEVEDIRDILGGERCEEFADAISIGVAESLTTDLILNSVATHLGISTGGTLYQTLRETFNIEVFQSQMAVTLRGQLVDAICGIEFDDLMGDRISAALSSLGSSARSAFSTAGESVGSVLADIQR
jgi:hypothetical protein|tara:strand:+ start:3249 stop:3929 length:681 start_codon:yes stop_codon:yes gene_type:complete